MVTLNEALLFGRPMIFNTDQGSQFTSCEFTSRLSQSSIAISMDGKGRTMDGEGCRRRDRIANQLSMAFEAGSYRSCSVSPSFALKLLKTSRRLRTPPVT
ncbi:hypothetical protein ETAA8_39700 [Anatilimnocola aggregata]|uniref:Uncharacterized protein n=1 Tax=Anatilimnocola aggregata TaxID=2528021 RepID=A0A517YF55_9BACT|nr:hypothetical protein ETAA8_39700 [Anatilimnocola aggregata]